MNCARTFDLTDFAFGALEPDAMRAAEVHVAECVRCQDEAGPVRGLRERLGALPEIEPSPDFASRVRRAFVEANPDFSAAPAKTIAFRVPKWAWALSAHAAAFLLLAFAFYQWFPKHHAATPSAPPPETPMKATKPTVNPPRLGNPVPVRTDLLRDLLAAWHAKLEKEHFAEAFALRSNPESRKALQRLLNAESGQVAVERALLWIASKQENDGHWSAKKSGGRDEADTAVTALALLTFLADGSTPAAGPHRDNVRFALEWLSQQQRADGYVGPTAERNLFSHAVSTIALLEAAAMTGDSKIKSAAQAAVGYSLQSQEATGEWDRNPVSTAWFVQGLRLALAGGNEAVVPALKKAGDWLATVTDAEGRLASVKDGVATPTAAGLFARIASTPAPDAELTKKQADIILAGAHETLEKPGAVDLVFLYYGALDAFQIGGDVWTKWNTLVGRLVPSWQSEDGRWALANDPGGEVFATAMATLTLQTIYRFPQFVE